jgi:hypothetical protein
MAVGENGNSVVTGLPMNPDFRDRPFFSLLDTVIPKAPAEVVVLHGTMELRLSRMMAVLRECKTPPVYESAKRLCRDKMNHNPPSTF